MPARSATMDLCLIGTSNGVFEDGYISAFRSYENIRTLSKNCLGFCSSALFALKAKEIDFSAFDICVLDFAPNDAVQLQLGVALPEVVRSALSDAVGRVLAAGCLPALLILPVLSVFEAPRREVQEIYLDIAARYDIPYFDGYRYLEFLQARGVVLQTLFKDDMHLQRQMAAQWVGYFLEGLTVAHRIRIPGREVSGTGFRYEHVDVREMGVDEALISHRSSSLFEADVVPVLQTGEVPLAGGAGREITAIGVDWANSSGSVVVAGANGARVQLSNEYSGDDPTRFVFGLSPVNPPVGLIEPKVTLALIDDTRGPARLTLGGFVLRAPAEQRATTLLQRPFPVSDAFIRPAHPELRDAQRWNQPIVYFETLEQFLGRGATPSGLYTVKILDTFFDLLVFNRGSPTTVVSFHAALPDRDQIKLPYFTGQSLAGADPNVVLVSDPALYADPTVPLAWFAGLRGCPVQEILPLMIESLQAGFAGSRLIFTGPSGGGFAALFYAHRFPGSLAIPSNPQTRIARFERDAVAAYCRACFGVDDEAGIRDVLERRITADLPALYAAGFENFVVYCQNASDSHVELHQRPFLEALPLGQRPRVAVVQGDWGEGHVAPPSAAWSRLIAEAVNWPSSWDDFVAGGDFHYLGRVMRPDTALGEIPASRAA